MKFRPLLLLRKILMYSFYGLSIQLCLCTLVLATEVSFAQRNVSVKEAQTNLVFKEINLKSVFDQIERNTDYSFTYEKREINNEITISGDYKDVPLFDVLMDISQKAQLKFKQINRNILVYPKSSDSDIGIVQIAEQVEVSGKVTDENGQGLPGASIIEKGTTNGTTTDIDGNYRLTVSDGSTLTMSFVGYRTLEINIAGRDVIDVQMAVDSEQLEEIVVVGYGTLSKAKILGAVSSVKSEDISELPVSGMDEAIAGRLAGVQVVSSGTPGSVSQIRVRGIGSITAGRSPLLVVDGYPLTEGSDLNAINPTDIESIEVLKDAASTAIYGSRGANGVIMISTKSGKSDKTSFNLDTYTGFQAVMNPMKFLDAYQFPQVVSEARNWGYVSADPANRSEEDDTATRLSNGASPRHLIPGNFDQYLAGTPGLTNNDWLDDVFRNGRIESYNLSASGGNDKTSWFVSGGYFNQEGLILGSGYERYSAKVKIETQLSKKIKFGINLSPSTTNRQAIIEGWTDSPMQQAILSEPFFTPFNDQGDLNISQQIRWHNGGGTDGALVENPVAIAAQKVDETSKFRLFGNTFLEIEIIEGLSFKTQFGGDFDYSLREQFRPSTIGAYRKDVSAAVPWAKERTRTRRNWISENTLNYVKYFDKHSLNLLAGYSYQSENSEETDIDAPLLDDNDIPNIAGTATTTTDRDVSDWVLISYFGRAQYDYDSRYLFSASIRRDGSSRFGDDSKFGIFPSLSAGWIVSNEDFFPTESFFNTLKLRYSWGKTGNNQIGNYGSIALLQPLNGYIDGGLASGQIPDTAPNADLSWETTVTNNIGLDVGMLGNRLNLGIDYFIANTRDMLLEVPVPIQSGFDESLQNIGEMENKGLELVLSTAGINLGSVKWSSSINFTKITNKVIALGPDQEQIIAGGTNITKVGQSIGEFFGYEVDGIYKSQAEIDESAQSGTSVKVGDWRIVDVDDNGSIDADDRTVIGSPLPDFTYGFNNRFSYKNFDLNIFIDGVTGVDVLSRTVRNATNGQGFSNQLVWYYENRWHPENNPNGTLARPDYTQSSERGRANVSSAFIQNGSFVRVRNITLGYNLPTDLLSKIGVERLRIYATAKNFLMKTDFRGYNPEQSRSNPLDPSDTEGSYPQNKSFVLGLNLSF